ncbi:hypothetical protein LY307_08110 [Caballeronia sp. CLC5]|nr:hypothetical protein [Caballeronia sp. CLC5]MCE4568659.1 hypothetical protein [Caballeronia sp. CLC5]
MTAKPDGTFRGKLRAEYADFNSVRLGASFSGPLVEDKLFASLSGQYYSTDGYIHNLTIDKDQDTLRSLAGRFVLRALPTEDFEIILRLDGSRNRNGYLGYGVVDDGAKRYATLDDRKVVSPDTSFGGSLTMSYDLPAFTIKSITGYQHVKTEFWYDFDGYSTPTTFRTSARPSQHSPKNFVSSRGAAGLSHGLADCTPFRISTNRTAISPCLAVRSAPFRRFSIPPTTCGKRRGCGVAAGPLSVKSATSSTIASS